MREFRTASSTRGGQAQEAGSFKGSSLPTPEIDSISLEFESGYALPRSIG
jgi:hypothetical protein